MARQLYKNLTKQGYSYETGLSGVGLHSTYSCILNMQKEHLILFGIFHHLQT